MPFFLRAHQTASDDEQREKAERKPRDHDLDGRKGAQQHLGRDERRAPDEHAECAEQVSLQAMIVLCILHFEFPFSFGLLRGLVRLRITAALGSIDARPVFLAEEYAVRHRREAVDEIFADYLSRPNVRQPILTQYCDGKKVSCPEWMTQWGSKYLGDQGYAPIEILRYYYGESMYINTAEQISGIPSSWPGYDLTIGSRGDKVRQIQQQLNRIAKDYPSLPTIAVDGVYGESTANAVRKFQNIFGLPQTGIVDYPTWYKISEIYVGVSRIAELN